MFPKQSLSALAVRSTFHLSCSAGTLTWAGISFDTFCTDISLLSLTCLNWTNEATQDFFFFYYSCYFLRTELEKGFQKKLRNEPTIRNAITEVGRKWEGNQESQGGDDKGVPCLVVSIVVSITIRVDSSPKVNVSTSDIAWQRTVIFSIHLNINSY